MDVGYTWMNKNNSQMLVFHRCESELGLPSNHLVNNINKFVFSEENTKFPTKANLKIQTHTVQRRMELS